MEIKKIFIGKGEMPKRCSKCRLCCDNDFGDIYCAALGNDLDNPFTERDPACPLEEEDE